MGTSMSRRKTKSCGSNATTHLIKDLKFLEEELVELSCKREKESRTHKRLVSVFAAKQAEWKRERRRWKEEVRRLRKRLEEKDEIVSQLEEEATIAVQGDKEWLQIERAHFLVEHLREEQARREDAVEKWKRLYLAIKTELDHLIQHQGERLWLPGGEDDDMERLRTELKTKDEMVEALRAQLSAMEDAKTKREREVDILRQSLRIMSNPTRGHVCY